MDNEAENYQIRSRKAKCIVILALCDDCRWKTIIACSSNNAVQLNFIAEFKTLLLENGNTFSSIGHLWLWSIFNQVVTTLKVDIVIYSNANSM